MFCMISAEILLDETKGGAVGSGKVVLFKRLRLRPAAEGIEASSLEDLGSIFAPCGGVGRLDAFGIYRIHPHAKEKVSFRIHEPPFSTALGEPKEPGLVDLVIRPAAKRTPLVGAFCGANRPSPIRFPLFSSIHGVNGSCLG